MNAQETTQPQYSTENAQENQEQGQVIPMFTYFQDMNGAYYPQMLPYFYQYFASLMDVISRLKQTVNSKWKKDEIDAYNLYLADLQSYIQTYIFTAQIYDYNVFIGAMEQYGQVTNPLGFQLYQIQLDYIIKKEEGFDFNYEKKKQKKNKNKQLGAQTQQPKKQREQKVKQEVEVIRKDDPTITAAELQTKHFQLGRYTDLTSFRKENANLVFIGHVDSGKSTLTGNIIKQLKQVDEQQLTRNKQEAKQNNMQAWQLAFIADVDPNQRKRGKTVQCSKMMFTLQKRRYTLFDAPGHKNYVPNMIMGACQADVAVLIISAKDGEFQSGFEKEGQTKEHAMLATALGVRKMIAVVTKMSTVEWSKQRYDYIQDQVVPFLDQSCGFKDVPFIPIDSITNTNIHSTQQGWYKGPSLIQILSQVELPTRDPDGPLRIPIVDKFRDVGQFFLYGKVQSGKIAYENQTVSLLPNREYLTIKEIYNAKDERLPYALAGQNVKLKIKGIEDHQVHRGDIICSNTNYCQQSQQFKANLTVLQLPQHKKLISSGYQCVIHMHAISEEAEISLVQGKIDSNRKTVKASFLRTGETGKVVMKLKNPLCMEKFDFMPTLGRFTLRDEGKTIGFGQVTKIKPSKNLTKEQKDQLGIKTEQESLVKEVKNLQIKQ